MCFLLLMFFYHPQTIKETEIANSVHRINRTKMTNTYLHITEHSYNRRPRVSIGHSFLRFFHWFHNLAPSGTSYTVFKWPLADPSTLDEQPNRMKTLIFIMRWGWNHYSHKEWLACHILTFEGILLKTVQNNKQHMPDHSIQRYLKAGDGVGTTPRQVEELAALQKKPIRNSPFTILQDIGLNALISISTFQFISNI